ncbi:hypothetical protein, partial [Staphylococcus arlettae]|uniref:hypothetical protein n=1 Tax=Staphylococcus arlettae TaxID=29378 RepID=UPI001EE65264
SNQAFFNASHPCRGGTTKSFFQNQISVPLHVLVEILFHIAVADCIENALQTKLFSTLVILAGVGQRNHFFKIRFLSHSHFLYRKETGTLMRPSLLSYCQ